MGYATTYKIRDKLAALSGETLEAIAEIIIDLEDEVKDRDAIIDGLNATIRDLEQDLAEVAGS